MVIQVIYSRRGASFPAASKTNFSSQQNHMARQLSQKQQMPALQSLTSLQDQQGFYLPMMLLVVKVVSMIVLRASISERLYRINQKQGFTDEGKGHM
ncbi:uncharacterized protein MEPE_02070 [Melanopsichium pennsylvanicum]|uniref:Uncharacterized protein n=1 Tax=Melanopsichium pennsylvanicum TaxID=63383 RepID=A0AAJ4XLN8_9BASI|nr:uncharacterized protein MEPE_02070 [Melanopsichium pennsylvanicum]